MNKKIVPEPIEFDWDKGNVDKNFKKHRVLNEEAEEVFLNDPLISEDKEHSKVEKRYQCLGITDKKINARLNNYKKKMRAKIKKIRIKI